MSSHPVTGASRVSDDQFAQRASTLAADRHSKRFPRTWTRSAAAKRAPAGLTTVAALLAAAAWLPFLHPPLGSDESGFLFLAQHWRHGTSLYGNYWVDRPPLLLWLFTVAGHLGPVTPVPAGVVAPGVKVLGAAVTAASVVLAALLTRQTISTCPPTGRGLWPGVPAVWLAVLLLASPLFGMPELDGELLALPFVLAGLVCLGAVFRPNTPHTTSARSGAAGAPRRTVVLAAGAGACGMCAALVKQNVIDVFVFATVAWVLALVHPRRQSRGLWRQVAAFASGAYAVLGAALAAAAAQGTSPAGLWEAIVVFRLQATAVIGSSASGATSERMSHVLMAALQSGAVAVLALTVSLALHTAYRRRRRPTTVRTPDRASHRAPDRAPDRALDLTWPVLALVMWEICGVLFGGSYWLHYLTGLVPGLVLLVSITPPGRWARLMMAAALAYATVANLMVWTQHATAPAAASSDAPVIAYLRDHAATSDGLVVAFGHPNIVAGTGLSSPYPELWSLPVRVRDPQLTDLQEVMAGPEAPRWMVVGGDSLATWGLDADSAQRYLVHHYVERADDGDWTIWQRRGHQAPGQH